MGEERDPKAAKLRPRQQPEVVMTPEHPQQHKLIQICQLQMLQSSILTEKII